MGANPKSRVAAMSGGIFLRYGLEKTVMTSLGAGFINHTPPGGIKAGFSPDSGIYDGPEFLLSG